MPFWFRSRASNNLDKSDPWSDGIEDDHLELDPGLKEYTEIYFINGSGYMSEQGCDIIYGNSKGATYCADTYGDLVFDFEFDVVLVDADGDVAQYLCAACQADGQLIFNDEWLPSSDLVDGDSYYIKVIEYTYGLEGTSNDFTVHGSLAPTLHPSAQITYAPSSTPTYPVPTPVPTTDTLAVDLTAADGRGLPFDHGAFASVGESLTVNLKFTGATRSAPVTVRLCKGEDVPGEDICSEADGKFVQEITFMKTVSLTAGGTNAGTSVSFTIGDVDAGDDYFLAVFVYLDSDASQRKLTATDDIDDDAMQVYITGQFAIYDYAPTPAPSREPTTALPTKEGGRPSFHPTYVPSSRPTVAPTECGIVFQEGASADWMWNEEVSIKIKMCDQYLSYSYGVADVLLYADGSLVDDLAQYEQVHDATMTLTYTVPSSLDPEAGPYQLRVIEYGHGYDSYSPEFDVLGNTVKPTPRPSPTPTKGPSQDGTLDCFHVAATVDGAGFALRSARGDPQGSAVPGTEFEYALRYYPTGSTYWPFTESNSNTAVSVDVAVRLCRGDCAEYVQTMTYSESVSSSGVTGLTYTLPSELPSADDYRFLVEVESTGLTCKSGYFAVAEYAPSVAPTLEPTDGPSKKPTPAPTGETIVFDDQPSVWVLGETYDVSLRVGSVDQRYSYGYGAVVDLLLYAAAPAGSSYVDPTDTLAVYAEVATSRMSVSYKVPSTLTPGTTYQLRAIEYTRGLDVYARPRRESRPASAESPARRGRRDELTRQRLRRYSDAFTVSAHAPTAAPTKVTAAPTGAPTSKPTDEKVHVTACKGSCASSDTFVGSGELVAGVTYTLSTLFTGTIDSDQLVSVSVCKASDFRNAGSCPANDDTYAAGVRNLVIDETKPVWADSCWRRPRLHVLGGTRDRT